MSRIIYFTGQPLYSQLLSFVDKGGLTFQNKNYSRLKSGDKRYSFVCFWF
ncbi:MAG: hypothetical protein LBK58_05650 [Prevotellaceae bacterium]|nr:hypothetical protein [Prevotellaceae bacterium]